LNTINIPKNSDIYGIKGKWALMTGVLQKSEKSKYPKGQRRKYEDSYSMYGYIM
jgi:hypothetical protein